MLSTLRRTRPRLLHLFRAWLVVALAVAALPGGPVAARETEDLLGEWVSLTDRFPDAQFTGWAGIGYDALPTRDLAFRTERPITLGGIAYPKGMGVYPYSELRYTLDRAYLALSGVVGPDGDGVRPATRLRFRALADDVLIWDSGPLGPGEVRRLEAVPVRGVQELRLQTLDETDGQARAPGAWADLRLLPARTTTRPPDGLIVERQQAAAQRAEDLARWRQRSAAEARVVSDLVRPGAQEAVFIDQGRSILIASDFLTARLGLEGEAAGALTLFDRQQSSLVFDGARTQVQLESAAGPIFRAGLDLKYDRAYSTRFADPAIGPLTVAQVGFRSDDFRYYLWLELGLSTQQPTVWHRATLFDELGQIVPVTLDPFGPTAEVYFGRDPQLLVDDGRLRARSLATGGAPIAELVGLGKPVVVWDGQGGGGLAVIAVDETPRQPRLHTSLAPARVAGSLRFEYDGQVASRTDLVAGPRLLVHVGADPRRPATLAPLRDVLRRLYPQRPPPAWARFQWISWYAWYMELTDDKLRTQVDAIRARFGDLGPWHVVVDAGWYIAEGRPEADWRALDPGKFPDGMDGFVDYAHARDVAVVLYFSAPHLDEREWPGDWLGLPGTVELLREDLIYLGQKNGNGSYAFDYDSPRVRAYLDALFDDFFLTYGVDGLQLDGLGNVESAGVDLRLLDGFGVVPRIAAKTLPIYRFHAGQIERRKPGALIQVGWDTPIFANAYANSFWYGDDTMRFRHPYPHPGLWEKIEYALFQALVLGQRPQFGSVYRTPNQPNINDQWLAAAVTIGAPMGLSFELDGMTEEALARYRLILNHYDPWADGVTADQVLSPTCFARQMGDLWAVSVVNPDWQPAVRRVALADCGITVGGDAAGIDLISWEPVMARNGTLELRLEGESVHTVLLRNTAGMLTSSSKFERSGADWIVSGPLAVPGVSYLAASSRPNRVLLDGVALPDDAVEYDPAAFVLTIRYQHDGLPQRLRIE